MTPRSRGRTPSRAKLCSVKGSTSAANVQKKYGAEIQLQEYGTYTLCVDALKSGAVDALTTDNAILAGYAAQEANKGKLKVVGQTFSTENYGVGLKLDDTAFCTKVTDVLKKWISSGEWQKSVDKWFGPAGFKPGAGNPPTPAACGSTGGATGLTSPPRRGMPPAHLGGRRPAVTASPLIRPTRQPGGLHG